MSDIINIFLSLLIILGIPMLYSLVWFILERRGNPKKTYLRYIFLFILSYSLFLLSYSLFLLSYFLFYDYSDFIIKKYFNYEYMDIYQIFFILFFILFNILYFTLYVKIMKKYLIFNDISLFFIFKTILTSMGIIIILKLSYSEEAGDIAVGYFNIICVSLFVIVCWILFFMNLSLPKDLGKTDPNLQERDGKKEKS